MSINSTTGTTQIHHAYSAKKTEEESIPNSPGQKKPSSDDQQKRMAAKTIEERIQTAVENLNKIFKPTHIEYQMHEESGKYFVKIIDDHSKAVLKQIPSEEFLEMVAAAKEQQGFLLDARA